MGFSLSHAGFKKIPKVVQLLLQELVRTSNQDSLHIFIKIRVSLKSIILHCVWLHDNLRKTRHKEKY